MKKGIHPPYEEVVFVDSGTGAEFLCGSTIQTKEKGKFEGKEYPSYRVSISSASHPFFTGAKQFLDSEGRVGKFQKKYLKKKEEAQAAAAAPKPEAKKTKRAKKV